MSRNTIQLLMERTQRGLPIDAGTLRECGITPANATYLTSAGWLQRLSKSVYLLKGDTLTRDGILAFLSSRLPGIHDIDLLLKVLRRLRENGNTVVVIEHNLDVIKTADWLIDLGPEGGGGGGRILTTGTPEQVAEDPKSHTGHYLRSMLKAGA